MWMSEIWWRGDHCVPLEGMLAILSSKTRRHFIEINGRFVEPWNKYFYCADILRDLFVS